MRPLVRRGSLAGFGDSAKAAVESFRSKKISTDKTKREEKLDKPSVQEEKETPKPVVTTTTERAFYKAIKENQPDVVEQMVPFSLSLLLFHLILT